MKSNRNLSYRLERFDFYGVARFVIFNRASCSVPISASLYEAYLSSRRKSKKGTAGLIMQHLLFLYAWADSENFDLERGLFTGAGIQLPNITKFSTWLEFKRENGKALSDGYVAHIINDCRDFVLWFVRRYAPIKKYEMLNLDIHQAIIAHQKAWAECQIKVCVDQISADINDRDYEIVESYFRGSCVLLDGMKGANLRNYIMWRLAWEFGLRIGEILALRVQDLNLTSGAPYISIVSLDERGEKEMDPRSPYQPKVKTLSRELGFLFGDSVLIELLELYVAQSRTRNVLKGGKVVKSIFLDHDFVFVVHDGSAQPLSYSAAQSISAQVRVETGVEFHWHLARHAFFNRRYIEASAFSENTHLIDNLVYWGGWKSSSSLRKYTRRATRDIARSGLIAQNLRYELRVD